MMRLFMFHDVLVFCDVLLVVMCFMSWFPASSLVPLSFLGFFGLLPKNIH
jgi:hypothetical protein